MSAFLKEDSNVLATKSQPEDVRTEFQALNVGCGIYSLDSRAKLEVRGGDRVRWLNGMVSNNIRDLAEGRAVYAFLLNAQGHIQADLYAFNFGDCLLVDVDRSQRDKAVQIFDHYIIADDVELRDVSERTTSVGLTGPSSRRVLERVGIPVPALDFMEFAQVQWKQNSVTILHAGQEMHDSWQVWGAPEHAASLWDSFVAAGAIPARDEVMNLFRIARGIPLFGQDIRERDLPQETGQMRALSFSKGCYLGQEIVERIRARGGVHRQFSAFLLSGPLPDAGTKIFAEDKDVGEVTSVAKLPISEGEVAAALGYVRREALAKPLRAGESTLTISPLPLV